LEKANPEHAFITSSSEKSELFDKAAAKFSAKVAA
jgi:coatomer protein complex subunit epsilon